MEFLCRCWRELVLVVVFALLVAFGITGSSLGWYRNCPGFSDVMSLVGERKLAGVYRGIRGDEFIAHGTAFALACANGGDGISRLDFSTGLAGRDGLAVHDLGVPVRHFSMIARPAVWGFFFFDLRRALSWYWWFPVFFCIFAVAKFLDELCPGQRAVNLLLGLGAAFCGCSSAWSFWPAYNIAGICLAGGMLLRAGRMTNVGEAIVSGMVAGWGMACSALSLYYPVVYPAAVLVGVVCVAGMFASKRRWTMIGIAASASLILFLVVLVPWYLDAAASVGRIAASVYPGRRFCDGGAMAAWEFSRGWLAPLTLVKTGYSNQCELQSPLTMVVAIFALAALNFRGVHRNRVFCASAACVFAIWIYQFIGLPALVSMATGLRRCNPPRLGAVLVLAQMIIAATIYHDRKGLAHFGKTGSVCLAFLSVMLTFSLLAAAPVELWSGFRIYFRPATMAVAVGVSGVVCLMLSFLALNRPGTFVPFLAAAYVAQGIVFNPVCVAPKSIEDATASWRREIPGQEYGGRMLVATGDAFLAGANAMTGGRSLNGYFHVCDDQVFDLFYKGLPESELFRRMQHVDAVMDSKMTVDYMAEVTFPERVRIRFSPIGYDFRKLPVDFVVVPRNGCACDLEKNPTVRLARSGRELDFYRVVR
ncbi:MAG: hypothetical protein MJ025_02340 [Victivallaceae bacterium]|nr:hypothetical protein [Victivallaceae bacterium]